MKRRLLLLLILTISFGMTQAITLPQTTEIPDTLYIGIPFYIHISLPAGVDSLHVVVPDSLPNFQILEQKKSTVKDKKEFIIKAAAFETGNLRFPPLKIEVFKKSVIDSSAVSSFNLNVRSVLPQKGEPTLRDIAGPLNVPWTIWNYIIVLLSLSLIGGLIYLILRYLRKNRGRATSDGKSVDLRPAWQIALEELETLQAKHLLEQGDFLNYHFGLSMVLRWFLEQYADFNAVEMTTSEIREILETRDFPRWVGIMEFLQTADTVKFAKYVPTLEQSASAYRWLYMYLKSFSETENVQEKESLHA